MQSRDKRGDGSSRHSLPWSLHDGDKAASIHFLYCSDTFPRTEIYANLSPLRPLQPWKLQDTHTLKENPCVTRKLKQRVSAATQSIASVLRLTPLLQCCDSLHCFSAATHSIAPSLSMSSTMSKCEERDNEPSSEGDRGGRQVERLAAAHGGGEEGSQSARRTSHGRRHPHLRAAFTAAHCRFSKGALK